MHSLWQRLPVIVRAVITGSLAAAAGTLPWAALVKLNATYFPIIPWAVPVTALYLWLYWKYARGAWPPASTAEARRKNSRANRLPDNVWGMAILAGVLGLVAVVLLQSVMSRLVTLPQQEELDIAKIPFMTVFMWILTGAVVAGVVEETSFRGYMQGPIERRHGPVAAILITGMLFGFMHFTHSEVTVILMPYYLAVAAVYGLLAYFTDSTLPGMVLHAGGNMFTAFDLIARGRSEWQASSTPAPLIWDTGADASFWISCVLFILVGSAAAWAYASLAVIMRKASSSAPLA